MRARPLKIAPTTPGASRKTRQRKKTDGIFHPSGSPAEPVALQITHVDRPSNSTAPNPPCLLLQRSDDGRDRRFSISPRDPAPGARAAPPTRTFRRGETTRGPTPAEREASIAAGAAAEACARKPALGAPGIVLPPVNRSSRVRSRAILVQSARQGCVEDTYGL